MWFVTLHSFLLRKDVLARPRLFLVFFSSPLDTIDTYTRRVIAEFFRIPQQAVRFALRRNINGVHPPYSLPQGLFPHCHQIHSIWPHGFSHCSTILCTMCAPPSTTSTNSQVRVDNGCTCSTEKPIGWKIHINSLFAAFFAFHLDPASTVLIFYGMCRALQDVPVRRCSRYVRRSSTVT